MGNLNKVMLIGRLGQDPEKRVTPSGASVVTISLATSEKFKDKQGNKQENTEWHRVVFWNKQADLIEQYCKKGSQLFVEGSLTTNKWKDKDGNERFTTEIKGHNLQFLDPPQQNAPPQGVGYGGPGQGRGEPQGGGYNAPQNQGPPQGGDDFIEDDIPF
jgi:single-strand DNA-binding protein